MVQGRGGLRLSLKAGKRLRIARHCIGQEFKRDEAVKAQVFRLVDHAHSAAAKFFDDSVVRDGPPDHVEKSYVAKRIKSINASLSNRGSTKKSVRGIFHPNV
jgi:hypothetical protein